MTVTVTDAAQSNQKLEPRRIVLLFSGGIDSTMTACQLAQSYDRVDLLTFKNEYGHYHISRTAKRAKELDRHFPNTFTHRIESVRDLFETLVLDTLQEDYKRFGSGFVWCMGCKLAMHTKTIIHCIEHGILEAADGSSFDTSEMVEQMPTSVAKIRSFYCENDITFENPVYKQKRSDSIRALSEMGFRMGFRIGDRFLGTQPKCKPGELYYMPLLLLGKDPVHPEKSVCDYIDEKINMARQYIDNQFDWRAKQPERKGL